jgi:hypothetical protein
MLLSGPVENALGSYLTALLAGGVSLRMLYITATVLFAVCCLLSAVMVVGRPHHPSSVCPSPEIQN